MKFAVARLCTGAALFLAGLCMPWPSVKNILYVIAFAVLGYDILWNAVKGIARKHIFDENLLMAIASLCAIALGQFPEAVTVVLFYGVGELCEALAIGHSKKAISSLSSLRVDTVNLLRDGQMIETAPEDVAVGQEFIVKPGGRVPLDGVVVRGESSLDTSALTGESVVRRVREGEEILSGCINQGSALTIRATKPYSDSTVSRIMRLVEDATGKKAQTERFITRFAKYYTPAVVLAALLIAVLPPLVLSQPFSDWIYRGLIFLVISCPCALVISIPLGFFGGIGLASRNGILIKGSGYLEALNQTKTVVLDKTGTLTQGMFTVTDVSPQDMDESRLLALASSAECLSTHPIAHAIVDAAGQADSAGGEEGFQYEEIAGRGVRATAPDGSVILAGNHMLLLDNGIDAPQAPSEGTLVYIALNGVFAGTITVSDKLKDNAAETVAQLKRRGIRTVMLTGDREEPAQAFASKLGIDEVHAQLLPGEKVAKLEEILSATGGKGKTLFVGDGINDAPALRRADVGIAMGGIGSDAAVEAADVVVMNDDIGKLLRALDIARYTRRIVTQNIVLSFGVKLLCMSLGVFGMATIWEAVFADVGVAVLAILNASRGLVSKNSRGRSGTM